jgi:hypothetical protein
MKQLKKCSTMQKKELKKKLKGLKKSFFFFFFFHLPFTSAIVDMLYEYKQILIWCAKKKELHAY